MSTPLRILVHDLLYDDAARATFAADPAGYLDEHGWADLEGADVDAALGAMVHELPIADAARLHPIVAAEDFGDGASDAVGRLQAAAVAFEPHDDEDDVDFSGSTPDPATTLDHDGDVEPMDQVVADDPSRGIDEEDFEQDGPELRTSTEGEQPGDDDDMGTIDDVSEPGSIWEFEQDEDVLDADSHVFDDPLSTVADRDDDWTPDGGGEVGDDDSGGEHGSTAHDETDDD